MTTFPHKYVRTAWRALGCLLLTFMSTFPAIGELIPSERLRDWSPGVSVGVPGGIERFRPGGENQRVNLIDVTRAPYGADKTGVSDCTAVVTSAIAAAAPNDVVYFPAGVYKISSLNTGYKDNITLRGEGPGKTILRASNQAVYIGGESDYSWNYPHAPIAVDLLAGASVIPIGDTGWAQPGQIVEFSILNDPNPSNPIVSVAGFERARKQKSRIVGKTTNSIKIDPPLHYNMPVRLEPRVARTNNVAEFTGLEDITLELSATTAPFGSKISQAYGCWFYNVEIKNVANRHLYLANSVRCEVRRCDFRNRQTDGSNGAGLLFQSSANCLIEDNIIANISPCIQINDGVSGSVVAFNLLHDPILTGVLGSGLTTNHGPHNSFNLIEGNSTPNVRSDGYFGSTSEDTLFRNWLHGSSSGNLVGWTTSFNRFTRKYSIVGNIIGRQGVSAGGLSYGNPNIGNSSYKNTAQLSAGIAWADWGATATLTKRVNDTSGTIRLSGGSFFVGQLGYLVWQGGSRSFTAGTASGEDIAFSSGGGTVLPEVNTSLKVFMGPSGYQELDLDVKATAIEKANYLYGVKGGVGGLTPTDESALPESLFRGSTKPAFFGDLMWPPFDPTRPELASFESIPAGFRYTYGRNPSGIIKDDIAPTPPVGLTATGVDGTRMTVSWTASSDNVGISLYQIERSQGAGSVDFSQVGTSSTTSFADTGLAASTIYNYRVRAGDEAGNVSAYSSVKSATTGAGVPKSPSNLRLKEAK